MPHCRTVGVESGGGARWFPLVKQPLPKLSQDAIRFIRPDHMILLRNAVAVLWLAGSCSAYTLPASNRFPRVQQRNGGAPKMMPPGYPPVYDDWYDFRHGTGTTEPKPLGGAGWAEPMRGSAPVPLPAQSPVPVEPVEAVAPPQPPIEPAPSSSYRESRRFKNWIAISAQSPRGPPTDEWRFNVQDTTPRPMGGW